MTPQTPFGAAAERSELLSRSEAAAYLGIAKQTLAIWKCTKRHTVPYVKIGRLIKYRKVDLDKFIADNIKTA
jgi:excisionase family DNA binding protein